MAPKQIPSMHANSASALILTRGIQHLGSVSRPPWWASALIAPTCDGVAVAKCKASGIRFVGVGARFGRGALLT